MVNLEGQLQTFCREWWPGFSMRIIVEIKHAGSCAFGCTANLQRCYRLKWLQSLRRWFVFSEVPCLAALTESWSLDIASEWIGQVIFFHYTGKEKWRIFVCKVIQTSKFFFVRWLGSRNMTIRGHSWPVRKVIIRDTNVPSRFYQTIEKNFTTQLCWSCAKVACWSRKL